MNYRVPYSFFILFWICILNAGFLQAQKKEIKFEHLSIEHGLSQSSAKAIIQDSKGFMWFGTIDGLNKYDGYTIKVYRHKLNDSTSLADNNINTLYEDRNKILWIGTNNQGICLYNKLRNNFINIKNNPDNNNSLSDNHINTIYQDSNGIIWVGTNNGLNKLELVDNKGLQIKNGRIVSKITYTRYLHNPRKQNTISSNIINKISGDKEGNLWIATNKGLNKLNIKTNRFSLYKYQYEINHTDTIAEKIENNINTLFIDRIGFIWLGTTQGLYKLVFGVDSLGHETHRFIRYTHDPDNPYSISSNIVTSIIEDDDDVIWVGTQKGGLNKLLLGKRHVNETHDLSFVRYQHDPLHQFSMSVDNVLTLYKGKANVLWVGTSLGGINKWDRATESIELYRHNPYDPLTVSSNQIRSIYQDSNGQFWIGTVDGGLNQWHRQANIFISEPFKHDPLNPYSLSNNHVRSILEDSNKRMWIGTEGGGLNRFDRQTFTFKHYRYNEDDPRSISHDNVWKIYEDSEGEIWIATFGGGLNKMVLDTAGNIAAFKHYQHNPNDNGSLSSDYVTTVYEDHLGILWIGTFGGGLNRWDRARQNFIHYKYDNANPKSIGSNLIYSIIEDSDENLWIGAKGNLNKYNRENNSFKRYTEAHGLPNNVVMGILDDEMGNLWISTNNGLSKFNKETEKFRNYDVRDGLQSNEFLVGAFCKAKDGLMMFGGINGMNAFYPEKIKDNPHRPEIVITGFKVFNEDYPLDTFITEKKTIKLSYRDKSISFDFVALNYIYSEKNSYAYKMEEFEDKWNHVKNRRYANYTNLPPGNYVFRVKGSNNDGKWNNKGTAIRLIIEPPFWRTWWFYLLLGITTVSLIVGYIKFRERKLLIDKRNLEDNVKQRTIEINKQKEEILRQAAQLAKANRELERANQEIKESAKLKEMFLANTSHEIRTPLNIIIGYTNLLLNLPVNKQQLDYLKNIQTSGKNLLVIINDILDFSKIEAGKLTIEKTEFDFRDLVDEVVNSILVKANEKNVQFQYYIDDKIPQYVFGDSVRLNQIIINLAANAIKFTHKDGRVNLDITQLERTKKFVTVLFKVIDTGIGMTREQMEKIFNSFTQARSDTTRKFGGTGLGLAIVKRLIELQGGDIWVESQVGKGSEFAFKITYQIGSGKNVKKKLDKSRIAKSQLLNDLRILLVDDNPVNRALAIDTILTFNNTIKIDEAENGNIAIDKITKNEYHIVIMDIQMPEMDGYEATKIIRNDFTPPKKDIPILGMSAHAMKEEREKCLAIGMNDYLTKPFIPEELFKKLEILSGRSDGKQDEAQMHKSSVPHDTISEDKGKDLYQHIETKFVDLALLNKTYKGNAKKLNRILNLCMNNIPKQLEGMKEANEAKDWKKLRTVAHSLKTTLNYLGMKEQRETAKTIELNAANEENLDRATKMIDQINEVWKTAKQEIENIISAGETQQTAPKPATNKSENAKTPQSQNTDKKIPDIGVNTKHVDLKLLTKTYKGDLKKMGRILKLCKNNIPNQIEDLHTSYEEKNWKNLRTVAHSLKTTLNYLGMKSSRELAKNIELNAAEEKNLEIVPEMIDKIEMVWQEASLEIETIMKKIL